MTNKAELQAQLDAIQASVDKLPDTKTLAVSSEHMLPYSLAERRMDLTELDRYREHVRRSMVHQLVAELIRSGAVKFQEDLYDDHLRKSKSLRTTAKLKIAA